MTRKVFLLIVFVALAVPALAQVTEKYDPFKRVIVVSLEPEHGVSVPSLRALGIREHVSEDPNGKNVLLGFMSSSNDWKYLKCHELLALADGEPVELGESEHDGTVGDGYVLEFVDVDINLRTLTKLASANEVRFRLCGTEITLSPARHADLVKFMTVLKGDKPKQSVEEERANAGRVTKIEGNVIWVNFGSDDGVKVGDELAVFPKESFQKMRGSFTVKKVIESHLSSGSFVAFAGTPIKVGDYVEK